MGNPIRLQPLFLILHCLLRQSSLLSVIGHYYTDLTLGASREFTLSKVSEEFNLHSTPQCTLFINPACRQFPMHSDWPKRRIEKRRMLKIADKLPGCLASLASTINLQSIGLPVFPTGAIVVVCTERENMISLVPGLPLGWEGITDPCFTKYSQRVCSSVLHTLARCPPGCMQAAQIILSALPHSCAGNLASLLRELWRLLC